MKRVLVTGASGFIGRSCLQSLQGRGYEVHAVARGRQAGRVVDVRWHEADLLHAGAARALMAAVRPTHLLHLAWYVVPGKLISSLENFAWVSASTELLREFVGQDGQRYVTAGSGYEYDWRYGYCSEALTPAEPDTVYGSCKRALNHIANALSAETGVSSAWARVFFLYGPSEHRERLVAAVIRALLSQRPAKCSHGRQVRDYMHVADVAGGLVALLDSDVRGDVNVCSGEAVSIREVVLQVGRLLGREELVELGALPARANDAPLVVGDNNRLLTETGWRPNFGLADGLQDTIDWWQGEIEREKGGL